MILVPHNDNNNFISFLLFKIFELKIVKSEINLIKEINGNFIGFEKNIETLDFIKHQYYNNPKIKKIIFPSTVKIVKKYCFGLCEILELDLSLCEEPILIFYGAFSKKISIIKNKEMINFYCDIPSHKPIFMID